MSNGLSNHDSGQRTPPGNKQAAAGQFNDPVNNAVDDANCDLGHDESHDEPLKAPDLNTLEELEIEAELVHVGAKDHPFRLIEARWEAKRLDALLREVYDEE
jgi:hypothetical protein